MSPLGAAGFLIRPEADSAGYSAGVADNLDLSDYRSFP